MASTANAALEVSYIITIIINSITFPFTIFSQRAGDNGRKNETTTPNKQQYFTGLLSGDGRFGRCPWTTVLYPVEDIPFTRSQLK